MLIDQDGVCTWRLEFERVGTGASCLTSPGVRHQGPCMPQRGHFGTLQRRQTVGGHPCQTLRGEPPPRASRPRRSPQAVRPSPSPGRGRPARASTRWSPLRRSLHGYLQGGGDWHMRGFSTQLVIAGLVLDACCRRAQEEFGRCSACFARLARDVPCPRGPAKRRRGGGGATDWPLPVTVLAHPVLLGTRSALCFWRTGGEAAT